jgi:hypothetical protein
LKSISAVAHTTHPAGQKQFDMSGRGQEMGWAEVEDCSNLRKSVSEDT